MPKTTLEWITAPFHGGGIPMTISPTENYYSSFDYHRAFGTNPFTSHVNNLDSLVDRASGPASGRSWDTYVARPGDREVKDYMSNVLGGQRNQLDDYVRRTAAAGVKRGGMNVTGGPVFDSALHQSAMKTLAAGYSDRFREAMDYNKYVKGTGYKVARDNAGDLQNFLNIQQRYVQGAADWQNRVGDAMRADWHGDVDWNRSEPNRQMQLEQNRLAMEDIRKQSDMQSWRNKVERQEQERLAQDRSLWTQVLAKAGLASRIGSNAAGWTSADDTLADYLGVRMGYLQPWRRSLNRSESYR
jgi:hypothetical protein